MTGVQTCALPICMGRRAVSFHSSSKLYASNINTYISEIKAAGFNGSTLLVIGHNPVLENLIFALANESRQMKPAQVAVLETKSGSFEHALLKAGVWTLVNMITC